MRRDPDVNCTFTSFRFTVTSHFIRDLQRPDCPGLLELELEQPSSRLWLGKKLELLRQLNLSRGTVVHASRQQAILLKNKKKSRYKDQKGEDCGGQRGGWSSPSQGGLPLNQGEVQYLTLRDLSSHDQDREEGKVGREEAAVPKGPLPI